MTRTSLTLLASRDSAGRVVLGAPAVGIYSGAPTSGTGLASGGAAGVLRILGRAHDLVLPQDIAGRVVEVGFQDRAVPVQYGERLFALETGRWGGEDAGPSAALANDPGAGPLRTGAGPAAPGPRAGLADGEFALRAPTAGVFYARPDPGSEPFVSVGGALEAGQPAGLIEVMKLFSPIVHPGGATPSPARVAEVRVREGEEVRAGQILFVLRAI